jgi:hypothetical protein
MSRHAIPGRAARAACLLVLAALAPIPAHAAWIWVEGEKPAKAAVQRHPYWYDQVKRGEFSGGDFISNWGDRPGEVAYRARAASAGEYELWVRANPIQSKLSYRIGDGKWTAIDLEKGQRDTVNVAADDKPDLRFLTWTSAGKVTLRKGDNVVGFRFESGNNNHGYLDCFVLADEAFRPRGKLKPGEANAVASGEAGWFAFDPKPDPYAATSAIDLRSLNEKQAGDGGFIGVKGSRFVHTKTGEPVRFWAVNGPPGRDRESLRRDAKVLAKRGVNLARIHHGYFDKTGAVDMEEVRHALEVVEALKAEGIYSHFSIYFPLWLDPAPDNPFLRGYDGKTHPFAALYFNKDFQAQYRKWWQALLHTPSPTTGKRLVDEPGVMGLEIINEDSYFFWTFDAKNIPDPQLRIVEAQFGDWLKAKYGSIDGALRAWGGAKLDRDDPAAGRVGFRPLWNIANERTARDKDTAAFLLESQRGFYKETYDYLRSLGFKGVITASNWATADPRVLGPLEKYSYTPTDFIDRHGYFGGTHKGGGMEWSIRDGHVYSDRSALRFEGVEPGKPRVFVHPAMDPSYDGKPSMISETTWNRPNRYRPEAPLYFAAYGALQGSDSVVHFAFDGSDWSVKPGYFMQPWTLMTPAMMGQFPAAALIYRKGLVAEGDLLVDLNLAVKDILDLKGTPLPQDAAFDELRAKDVPRGTTLRPGNVIDPLVHYAGRTNVNFSGTGGPATLKDTSRLIDRARKVVVSTTGQLRLDYGKGVLTIDAPSAQGAGGDLKASGRVETKDLSIASNLDLIHIVAVALDGKPLASSGKILLQVMTEEKPSGFRAEPSGPGEKRIVSIGRDPWLVREAEGVVRFKRADASRLKVVALDPNGDPGKALGNAAEIQLDPRTVYYLIAAN